MCFSVPYKIIKVNKNSYLLENGKSIHRDTETKAKVGEYAQITGNVMVGVLTKTEGEEFYKLFKRLNNEK